MLSPRSRGKGGRRVPGRDGGRGKRTKVKWRHQAVHAVERFPEHVGEIVELTFPVPYGRSAGESIYLFDQRLAGTGIRYQVELRGTNFVIRVPASCASKVNAIIAQIKEQ